MRLIDADKYLEKVCTYKETGCGSCKLQTMCPKDAPTVKAIPIEWFKKEIDWHLETVTYGAEVYQWVLNKWYEDKENWEKENENR